MSVTDEYLKNNQAYAAQFGGQLPLPPANHVAVVACMDARLNVYAILGLKEGEAHVIRNAGGVVVPSSRWRSASGCSVRPRSSSSTTLTAAC
jgi:carbonic anhydrase